MKVFHFFSIKIYFEIPLDIKIFDWYNLLITNSELPDKK